MSITKNIVTDYSCPTNGTSDCRAAFLAFKADAQGQDATLTVPAHTYNFKVNTGSNADQCLFDGIPNLVVEATGATFTDDSGAGGINYGTLIGIPVASPQSSARIQTATAGQSSVTVVTSGDASIFTVGRWVAVAAFDTQGGGSDPPNPFYFEFAQIQGIAGGVISFASPLAYGYLSTFPLYDAGNAFQPDEGGPATIYALPANWDTTLEFRGLTMNITTAQAFAKGKSVKWLNCTVTGGGSMIPTCNKTWTLSGSSSNFPFAEVDKFVDTVTIEAGATHSQLFHQSSCPNTLIIDNATVTNLNGTPRQTIVRNGGAVGSLRLGALGYGRTDFYEQSGGTIGSISYQPPQYAVSSYPSISGGLITQAIASGPVPWGAPDTNVIISGTYDNEGGYRVISASQVSTDAKIQTNIAGGWPSVPGTLKIGPHPCPRLRLSGVTGCVDAVDFSQSGAYDKPYASYCNRTYSGLTGSAVSFPLWGWVTSIKLTVVTPAVDILHVLGQFDNYPTIKQSDGSQFSYGPTANLSTGGVQIITPPEPLWFQKVVTPYCSSTTAVFSIEIAADQGFAPSTMQVPQMRFRYRRA